MSRAREREEGTGTREWEDAREACKRWDAAALPCAEWSIGSEVKSATPGRERERERGGTRARAGEESTSEGETRRHHWLALGRPRSPLEPRTRRGLVLDHAGSCSSLLLLVDLRAHARSAPRASSWTHVRPDFLSAELCRDSAGTGLPSLSASAPKDARGSRGKEVAHTPSGPRTSPASPASLSALAPLSSSTACVPLGSRSRALSISLPSASAPSLPP